VDALVIAHKQAPFGHQAKRAEPVAVRAGGRGRGRHGVTHRFFSGLSLFPNDMRLGTGEYAGPAATRADQRKGRGKSFHDSTQGSGSISSPTGKVTMRKLVSLLGAFVAFAWYVTPQRSDAQTVATDEAQIRTA